VFESPPTLGWQWTSMPTAAARRSPTPTCAHSSRMPWAMHLNAMVRHPGRSGALSMRFAAATALSQGPHTPPALHCRLEPVSLAQR
jgi:hypothetical protein